MQCVWRWVWLVMSTQLTFPGFGESLEEKVKHSIEVMRAYEPPEGYWLGFSGGKDSCALKKIAELSGVKFTAHYTNPTIDPPELVYFIRDHHKDVIKHQPKMSLWTMAATRSGLPTRVARWCCKAYKEGGGNGCTKAFGVRAAESSARKNRWKEWSYWEGDYIANPLYRWTDAELWEFLEGENVKTCALYKEGFKRLGCVGCPMSRDKRRHFTRWPGHERNWRRAARTYWARAIARKSTGKTYRVFSDADEWFDWWTGDDPMPTEDDGCQMGLFQ